MKGLKMELFRQMYLNPHYVVVNGKAHQIERILFHDGEKVITTTNWLRDIDFIISNNSTNQNVIIDDLEVKSKRKIDLTCDCFIIPTTYKYAFKNENTKDLYINIKYFDFEVKQSVYIDHLQTTYKSNKYKVGFISFEKDLHKESRNYQYHTIYKTIEEIENNKYSMKGLENSTNKLKRQIKKYQSILEKENNEIETLKQQLKEVK